MKDINKILKELKLEPKKECSGMNIIEYETYLKKTENYFTKFQMLKNVFGEDFYNFYLKITYMKDCYGNTNIDLGSLWDSYNQLFSSDNIIILFNYNVISKLTDFTDRIAELMVDYLDIIFNTEKDIDKINDKIMLPILSLFSIAFKDNAPENIKKVFFLFVNFFELVQIKYKFLINRYISFDLLEKCSILRNIYKEIIRTDLYKYRQFLNIMILFVKISDYSSRLNKLIFYQSYESLYKEIIIIDKELQLYDFYSSDIYNFEKIRYYYKAKNRNKFGKSILFIRNIPMFLTGYGEKPHYLIFLFLFLLIFFPTLYFIPCFDFNFNSNVVNLNKFISYLYFSCTTMLTIGYGDITPKNEITMLVVMFQQIIGFITAGSFIALYLRKLFRY